MNQVLSQGEVDALLAAVSEGGLGEDESASASTKKSTGGFARDVRDYDLTSQDRVFRGRMPILEVIHEKFCRDFRQTLSLDLGRLANLEPSSITLMKFQDLLNSLPVPSCLALFKIDPLPGNGIVVVESQFVFTLVDIFCGGSGHTKFRVEGRDFSSIEIGIVRKIVVKALAELGKALMPVFPVNIEFLRAEINPQFVSIAHPTEVVVNLEQQVEVEGALGRMQIVIPYATIEPIRERLSQNYVGDKTEIDKMWKKEVRAHLQDAAVELRTIMGTTDMTIRRILDLKPGDLLTLDRFADQPLDLLVEDITKMKVETGVLKGYKALKIISVNE